MPAPILVKHKRKLIKASILKNNFGLSQEEFDQYVEKTKSGDESFFVLLSQVHFDACIKFLIGKYNISRSDAYDLCMDTLLVFRKKLLTDKVKYGNLNYLYTRMASNIFLDQKKQKDRVENAMSFFVVESDHIQLNEEEFLDVLDKAVEDLDNQNRQLLNELYYENKDIHKLAEERNISYPALRKRKQRMLEKLKDIFKQQLKKQ